MADRSKALDYLQSKYPRLTRVQQDNITEFIVHSLLSKVTDIDWEDSVDYAVKQVKQRHPKPITPPVRHPVQLQRHADGSFGVRRG